MALKPTLTYIIATDARVLPGLLPALSAGLRAKAFDARTGRMPHPPRRSRTSFVGSDVSLIDNRSFFLADTPIVARAGARGAGGQFV